MPGAVCTASPHATAAAIDIFAKGGNAMDAAMAAAWALSVCEPSGSGLGGHTVLLVRDSKGDVQVIEGCSPAPQAASTRTISAAQQRFGRSASTVPSTVATLDHAQRAHGRLPRVAVLGPARRLAECGFRLTRLQQRESRWVSRLLSLTPETAAMFLGPAGNLREGDVLRQPLLAATLDRIADAGAHDFYHGEIARSIGCDMKRNGGWIGLDDLQRSGQPHIRKPLVGYYREHRIMTAPPPSGGLQLLLALEFLERAGDFQDRDAAWYGAVAAATRHAFRCRHHSPRHWTDHEEPGETTHLAVADDEQNVVTLTQSIQSLYGAKVAHPSLGFLYNNYLCTLTRDTGPFSLHAGNVPRSNAAPTLVFRPEQEGGGLLLALGAAGSRRITSSILQTISAVIDLSEPVDRAVAAPRVHGLMSGAVRLECDMPEATKHALSQSFQRIVLRPARDFAMGAVHALQLGHDGDIAGGADPRRDGVFQTTEAHSYAK